MSQELSLAVCLYITVRDALSRPKTTGWVKNHATAVMFISVDICVHCVQGGPN